jgi:hypothetical protein
MAVFFLIIPSAISAQVLVENQPATVRGGRIIAITVSHTNPLVAIAALALDGAALGPPVPNGFWTGWRTVSGGQHVVTAIAVPAMQGSVYQLVISGDCSAGGVVTAASGLAKTCIVTATRQ